MQDSWWRKKAQDVEHFAETHNSKMFFSAIKSIYGPTQSSTTPLLSADGTRLIKDKEGINERWPDHFSNLLNRPSSLNNAALDTIPEQPAQEELDLPPTQA